MIHSDGYIAGCDGGEIYYQVWSPEGAPRAVLMVAHGMAEHGGRYSCFAEYFAARGYAVAALDHCGHGRSSGHRCFVSKLSNFVDTLELFRLMLVERFDNPALFLIGHSMGGLISANYLAQYQQKLAGCILSGPALKADIEPQGLQLLILKLISALLPKMGVIQLDGNGVSRDPEEVKAYMNDPLVYTGKLPARIVIELFEGMKVANAAAPSISVPMLLLHGGSDSMTSPDGSREYCAALGSSDKSVKVYPGLYHEIFNEPEREQVFADIDAWLEHLVSARD